MQYDDGSTHSKDCSCTICHYQTKIKKLEVKLAQSIELRIEYAQKHSQQIKELEAENKRLGVAYDKAMDLVAEYNKAEK